MAKKTSNKTNPNPYLAIVAVVAIIAVILLISGKSETNSDTGLTEADLNEYFADEEEILLAEGEILLAEGELPLTVEELNLEQDLVGEGSRRRSTATTLPDCSNLRRQANNWFQRAGRAKTKAGQEADKGNRWGHRFYINKARRFANLYYGYNNRYYRCIGDR